jgi:hypothetical protein
MPSHLPRLWPDGRFSDRVTIVESAENLGSHSAEELIFPVTDDPKECANQNAEFDREAVYCCGGYAALLAAGYSDEDARIGCWNDFDKAEALTRIPLATIQRQAVALMRQPENIAAVTRIADELMRRKTISGEHVETLIELSDGTISDDDYQAISRMQRWD